MFRFFRHIRLKLFNEGKVTKYLGYAVGEFLLIVAGILAALQIQTWNEERKLAQDRRELIEDLRADFNTNLEVLEVAVSRMRGSVEGLEKFLEIVAGSTDDFSIPELKSLASNAYIGEPFTAATAAYQTAVATGAINLIEDKTLRQLLIVFESELDGRRELGEIALHDQFIGASRILRNELGSLNVLAGIGKTGPESDVYALSDQEYRALITQKDVYSVIEGKWDLRRRFLSNYERMKGYTEQILAALEALD